GLTQTRETTQKGRLPRAVAADEADALPWRYAHGDILKDRVPAVKLCQPVDRKHPKPPSALAAGGAVTVELEGVTDHLKAGLAGRFQRRIRERTVVEASGAAAVETDEMMVMISVAGKLEPRALAGLQIDLVNETDVGQHPQIAVHR